MLVKSERHGWSLDSHPSRKNKDAARMGHPEIVGWMSKMQTQVLRLALLAQDDKFVEIGAEEL